MWVLDSKPSPQEIQEFNDCGISVFEDEDGGWYFGVDGCGYDFYEAHWIDLYRHLGICHHSTENQWLEDLSCRICSYIEMCAEIPADVSWRDRHRLLGDVAKQVLGVRQIERAMKSRLRRLRLRKIFDGIVTMPRRRRLRKRLMALARTTAS